MKRPHDYDERDILIARVVFWGTLALGALLLASKAFGCTPDELGHVYPVPYSSAEAAVLSQLKPLLASHPELEAGGEVVELKGRYYASLPESGTANSVCIQIVVPHGARIVAIYHTHPGAEPIDAVFSEVDIGTAEALHIPSYIGVTEQGIVIRWRPGDDTYETVSGQRVAHGTTIYHSGEF